MEAFRIKNIKSFTDSKEIEVKPITIFVGKNSCGKSSLIRFLAVLGQTDSTLTDSPIRFYGDMVDYGYYEDVKHYGSDDKISFELKYNINVNRKGGVSKERISNGNYVYRRNFRKEDHTVPDFRDIIIKVVIDKIDKIITVDRIELMIEDKCLFQINREDSEYNRGYYFTTEYVYDNNSFINRPREMNIPFSGIEFEGLNPIYDYKEAIKSISRDYIGFEIRENDLLDIMELIQGYSGIELNNLPEQLDELLEIWDYFDYYNYIMSELSTLFDAEFSQLKYIGPFRNDPSRIYRDLEYNSNGVGVRGENTCNELIHAYMEKEYDLIKNISCWTKNVLGSEITLRELTSGLFQIMLKDGQGIETNLIDNGYGISQVLPVIVETIRLKINAQKYQEEGRWHDRILLLEQPELHLHPAAQSELADLFVECALTKDGRNKIVIETHSEHLIRKLQVLIASQDCPLTNEMVRIYYVDKDEDGNSYVEEMHILENGKFKTQWPSGFFDKGYLLSRELARAGLRD